MIKAIALGVGAAVVALVALGSLLPRVEAGPPKPVTHLPRHIVSPPPDVPLKFSHRVHSGPRFPCTSCHAKAAGSSSAGDLLLPEKKNCTSCHKQAIVPEGFGLPGKRDTQACRYCHTRFLPNGFPVRVRWKAPRFRFPHKLHLARGQTCQSCHRGIANKTRVGKLHLPTMADCLKCHTGKGRASARCVACHDRIPGGKMRTRFPGGKLKPGPSLPALNHGPLFKRNHKAAARAHAARCTECHEKSTCQRCHGGTTKPATIHVGNVILLHGREARANRKRCQSCHTQERFCLRCHSRLGLSSRSQRSPFRLPGQKKFHGPNWASSTSRNRGRNRHAVHARRNATVCAACHRERSCTTCHARRRAGGLGFSPHGPGFAGSARCRILARKAKRACIKCHGLTDPIARCR